MRFKVQDVPIDHFLVHFGDHRVEIPLELCDSKLLLKDVTSICSASHACHTGQVTTITWERLENISLCKHEKRQQHPNKERLKKVTSPPMVSTMKTLLFVPCADWRILQNFYFGNYLSQKLFPFLCIVSSIFFFILMEFS